MNGGADLGGMMGFGPVVEEDNEPNFHALWEERAMAMVVAMGACGQWNLDQSRFSRESLPPASYLSFPYYRIWIEGLQKLLLETNMATPDEIASGNMSQPAKAVPRIMEAANVDDMLSAGGPVDRKPNRKPGFGEGNTVRTLNIHPEGHTRLPRYARGKIGIISRVLGFHVFPDSNARGKGEAPQWLYQIRFSARELWGDDKNPRDAVTLDLWEPYIERP